MLTKYETLVSQNVHTYGYCSGDAKSEFNVNAVQVRENIGTVVHMLMSLSTGPLS